MIKKLTTLMCLILICFVLKAQNTVGLLTYNQNKAFDGYNLLYQHNQPSVFLLDNCGEIVHKWEGEPGTRPANTAYLLEDGRLVKTVRPASIAGDRIWAGGGGATVEIRDWDNNLEWSYTLNDSTARLHHDIAVIEKNNKLTIAMVAWEIKTLEEVIQAGRDTSVLSQGEMWPDYILEIDPVTDEIIWEWHAWDHLVQDFDDTKDNFGVIGDNPTKIDINHDFDGTGKADWMHVNALDYNPQNDYFIMSVPNFSEVWVIDHSTTTEQAQQSFGGLSNLGGDLMYRWGNPQIYDQGDSTDQRLFFQHDANFIDDYISESDPNYGKIAVFNNRVASDFSTANVFDAGFDDYMWNFPFENGKFGPDDVEQTFTHPVDPTLLFSTGLSSIQYLPNSNYLITSGRFGYTFELTPDNEIVWEYKTPQNGTAPATQGDTLQVNNNLTFRVKRIPPDFPAFDGRDLTPKGWIELEPNTSYCDELTFTEELITEYGLEVFPNPATNMITLKWDAGKYINVQVIDMLGRPMIDNMTINGGRKYIDTSAWETGIYIVRINEREAGKFLKI
jgi:hypothetical protein